MDVIFDQYGNLVPPRRLSLTSEQVELLFVNEFSDSKQRRMLWLEFGRYRQELHLFLQMTIQQWLGGSFISQKLEPNDIDVVNLIPFTERLDREIDLLMAFLLIGGSKEEYGVDGHFVAIYPESNERYGAIPLPSLMYWQTWLGHDRNENPRGFIEMSLTD